LHRLVENLYVNILMP